MPMDTGATSEDCSSVPPAVTCRRFPALTADASPVLENGGREPRTSGIEQRFTELSILEWDSRCRQPSWLRRHCLTRSTVQIRRPVTVLYDATLATASPLRPTAKQSP